MDIFINVVLIPPKGDSDTTNRDRPRRPGEPETEQPGNPIFFFWGGGGGVRRGGLQCEQNYLRCKLKIMNTVYKVLKRLC